MAEGAVWCVFQRLPGESCPVLAAVCESPQAAEALIGLSHREQEEMGDSAGEWTVQRWSVLGSDVSGIADADRISHIMQPMRDAEAEPPTGTGGAPDPASAAPPG